MFHPHANIGNIALNTCKLFPIIFKIFNARSQILKNRSVFTVFFTKWRIISHACHFQHQEVSALTFNPSVGVLPVHCGSRAVFWSLCSVLGRVERSAAPALSLGSVSVSPCSCSECSFRWMMVMVENGHETHLYVCSPATQTHAAFTQTSSVQTLKEHSGIFYSFPQSPWLHSRIRVFLFSNTH